MHGAGTPPQATVVVASGVMVGKAAGLTVIILDTGARARPQASIAVHVSVTVPPQAFGVVDNVDGLEVPLIKQPPLRPFEYERVVAEGIPPQVTVISPGEVIAGKAAGLT